MVAPYPEFFSGLAALTRRTADAFEAAGLDPKFEVRTAATNLLKLFELSETSSARWSDKEAEKNAGKLQQLGSFQDRYYQKHRPEMESNRDAWKKLQNDLKEVAKRVAATGQASEADVEILRSFHDCRESVARLLRDFAPVCDRLAGLAGKSLAGETLTEADANWIKGYGVTLARFHFYYGNSYEVPADNFPIVTRVFSNPLLDSMLYAGLARPQALYVIVPDGKNLQLYRGAVLTYREFVRPNDKLLDDESWREVIGKGQTPPAPPFTRSFCAETSVPELVKQLRIKPPGERSEDEELDYGRPRDLLWQIQSRASEKDVPLLLDTMIAARGDQSGDIMDSMADTIAVLPWEAHIHKLTELLAAKENALADAAARILTERPTSLDSAVFISGFAKQPVRTRRLYCAILGRLPKQTEDTRKFFLQALHDPEAAVRWQAALAIAKAGWNDTQSQAALLGALNDQNELVGAAAALSLGKLGATNAAGPLLAKLKSRMAAGQPSDEELQRQCKALQLDQDYGGNRSREFQLLDEDNLAFHVSMSVPEGVKQRAEMRFPPMPFDMPDHNFDIVDALVEALGNLNYGPAADDLFRLRQTRYSHGATLALNKVAPERLHRELVAKACDKSLDSYFREQALFTLGTLSATNVVRELAPLLDDTTAITYTRSLPGVEWRICDRAAATVAVLLRWEDGWLIRPMPNENRLNRARAWAKAQQALAN
jgi:HEAT repeat protein